MTQHTDLQCLLDERDIARQLSTFARLLDEREFARIDTVFAEDLSFDYGLGREEQGIAALRAVFENFLTSCGPTQHLLGSMMVSVDGDRAHSRSYVQARHQRRDDPGGPILDTNGEYNDDWMRTDWGWRISRRVVRWHQFAGDLNMFSEISDLFAQ